MGAGFAQTLEYHTQCTGGYCVANTCTASKSIGDDCAADFECGYDFNTNQKPQSEKDAKLAQKLDQFQPFIVVRPPEYIDQFASFGPT